MVLGGLARTDRAGYGEEFGRLAADLVPPRDDTGDGERGRARPDPAVPEDELDELHDDEVPEGPAPDRKDDDGR